MKLRVLFLDIETAPLLAHAWRVWKENIGKDQLINDSFMLCWAAKWDDSDEVLTDRLTQKELLNQDSTRITQSMAELIREADVVVAHNADRFDLATINAEIMLHDLEPLGPTQTIDTLKIAKQNFRFPRYSLDYLGSRLVGERKIKVDFELWRDVYQGSIPRLKEMVEYNVQDVILLEKVFERMRPHVRRLTRLYEAEHDYHIICPSCGTEGIKNMQKRGFYRTQASTFQRYQCQNCRRYFRDRVSIKSKRARHYPL